MVKKETKIDAKDAWKYKSSHTYSDMFTADLYYNDKGEIDEKSTYSELFLKEKEAAEDRKAAKDRDKGYGCFDICAASSNIAEELCCFFCSC